MCLCVSVCVCVRVFGCVFVFVGLFLFVCAEAHTRFNSYLQCFVAVCFYACHICSLVTEFHDNVDVSVITN